MTTDATKMAIAHAADVAEVAGDKVMAAVLLAVLGSTMEGREPVLLEWMMSFTFGPGDCMRTVQ